MFNAFNTIWEQFSRVPGTLMANLNNPLSVTVVQNEGIISQDFFKSLTSRKEMVPSDSLYVNNTSGKGSLNIVERVPCTMISEKQSYIIDTFDRNVYKSFKNDDYVYIEKHELKRSDENGQRIDKSIGYFPDHFNSESNLIAKFDSSLAMDDTKEEVDHSSTRISINNIANKVSRSGIDDFKGIEIDVAENVSFNIDAKSVIPFAQLETVLESTNSTNQTMVSNVLMNMWQRFVNGVTDRLHMRTEFIESDMCVKKSYLPKQRRKMNSVAKGRGRGRARSQLRRSGVSQTRHRKERSKHDLTVDMQDDFEAWQEFEEYQSVQHGSTPNDYNSNENELDEWDAAELVVNETGPITFTFADIKPISRKPKTGRMKDRETTRMRFVPEYTLEMNQDYEKQYDLQKNAFRPRLMSESSADSEDSYCIIFETGSEMNCTLDFDNEWKSTESQSSEDEKPEFQTQKVKFDLKPVVHVMVQWDFAYRAARKGPWEEMARDRERFRGRIKCIECILNPILSTLHRAQVWQERFALDK
ncbi:hypothetical protein KM043_001392 [Ampulex compressa]|nr:hypothetical protein KM043_001392 [Ampulex compressa]